MLLLRNELNNCCPSSHSWRGGNQFSTICRNIFTCCNCHECICKCHDWRASTDDCAHSEGRSHLVWAGLGRLAACLLWNTALLKCFCALKQLTDTSVNFCWLKQLARHPTCFSRLQFWCISAAQGLVFLLGNGKMSAGKLNTRAERLTKIALKCRNQCSWKLIARRPWYQLGSALLEWTWGNSPPGGRDLLTKAWRGQMTVLYELNVSHKAEKGFCPGSTQLIFSSALCSHCHLQLLAKEKGAESKGER